MEKLPPIDRIKSQIVAAENRIGERLIPDPESTDEILNMSREELKSRFPLRYKIYVDLLRSSRRENTSDVSDEKIEEFKKWLGILNSLDKYDKVYRDEVSEDPRHPKQQEVFSELRDFLEQGNKSGYIKLPTGSGKTIIFKRFLEAVQARSLVVVPNNVLVEQTFRQLNKSTLNGDVGVVNMDSKEFESKYTVTTYASLIRNLKSGELRPEDYSFVILDEAHKALGIETSEAIRQFSDAVKIGFTATPEYTTEKGVSQLLDREICRMDVDEAIRAGMLSHARTEIIRTRIDLSSVPIKNGEYVVGEMEQKLNVPVRNKAAVDYYMKEFVGKQGVAYCIKISHAESVKKLFVEAGVEAEVISGKNTKEEKRDILERYKKGEIKILCNADILIEGFDHDKAAVCLNLRPTMSAVIAEQRGGRVLRLDAENTDKWGYVIDFLDDDQSASNQNRPVPILYREVLGAMAVPRAIASESSPRHSQNGSSGSGEDEYGSIDGLTIISTEEQFEEIMQQKEGYKMAARTREEEKKRKMESREKARQLYEDYVRIKPEFDIVANKTRSIVRSVNRRINIRWEEKYLKTRDAFDSTMDRLYRYSANGSGNIYTKEDHFYRINLSGPDIPLFTAKELKEKIDALYSQAKELKDKEDAQFAQAEKSRTNAIVFDIQNEDKIRLGNSEETKNWLTRKDLKDRGRSHGGVSASLWAEKINELEREHEEWVALRELGNNNFAHVYSPRFLEEIEHKVFQTLHRKEMVIRGAEAKVRNWKTELDMHKFVDNLGLKDEQISSIIRRIEMNHPQWIALRESGPRNLGYVYSPEFFDLFETEALNEVVKWDSNTR